MKASLTTTSFGDLIDSCSSNDALDSDNISSSETIRSSAVVTYCATKQPTLFKELAPQTNLNLTPSNWLRSAAGLRPNMLISGNQSQFAGMDLKRKVMFSSFEIANDYMGNLGNIDVVSDAENIKKLLKVPYSKSHISMAVHRIGKTLLLEQFDKINHSGHLQDWYQYVHKKLVHSPKSLKKKLPSAQLERLMNSKFLYYSLTEEVATNKIQVQDLETKRKALESSDQRWKLWNSEESLLEEQFNIAESFERKILWSFEDLEMLLGTNMPIFGDGKYPAVSLRLHDFKKPINVLTGLDYWLDNLICNVPELVMCFHVNGIVQNYEVIKTEDIPKMSNSKFNPQVIKDIAQNILSFLKSNCTKEGHTYWLFKGSNEDVVKLYDLTTTTLCDHDRIVCEYECHNRHNPFTIPVASLMYKMALNMLQQENGWTYSQETILKLLNNCVELLETRVEAAPVMLTGVLCLLSTLHLSGLKINEDFYDRERSVTVDFATKEPPIISTVSKYHLDASAPASKNSDLAFETNIPEEQTHESLYRQVLIYVSKGLRVLKQFTDLTKKISRDLEACLWTKQLHLTKTLIITYFSKTRFLYLNSNFSSAIKYVRMALHCYECLETMLTTKFNFDVNNIFDTDESTVIDKFMENMFPLKFEVLFPKLLVICGDLQLSQLHSIPWTNLFLFSDDDIDMMQLLGKPLNPAATTKYSNLCKASGNSEETLKISRECYEIALQAVNQLLQSNASNKSQQKNKVKFAGLHNDMDDSLYKRLQFSVTRKLGHICNEQGAFALSRAIEAITHKSNDFKSLWKSCYANLKHAQTLFVAVSDITNQALVLSNIGKLMRVSAQSIAQENNNVFTDDEHQLYENAIDNYNKALTTTAQKHGHTFATPNNSNNSLVYTNVRWELSGAYLTMAKRLQESVPSNKSREEVERQISDLMTKSLKICLTIWKNSDKRKLAVYRCAKIHSSLASLHHSSFRDSLDSTKKRHYRTLADSHYSKACAMYKNLEDEHPSELLRVQLERLALVEQNITFLTGNKTKSLFEGLALIKDTIYPLQRIRLPLSILSSQKLFSIDLRQFKHYSFLHANRSINNEVVVDWLNLTEILAKIIKSLLHQLIKYTSIGQSKQTNKKRSPRINTNRYEDLKAIYSSTLRNLQSSGGFESESDTIISENTLNIILTRIETLLNIINDIESLC